MDPEKYEKTPSELPTPRYKLDIGPQSADNPAESATSTGIEAGHASAGQQSTAMTTTTQQLQPVQPASNPGGVPVSSQPLPQIADDNDLIEKEWVAKAKQIVEQTKHDPRAQNAEMSVVKAGYIKKRFNKDIKVNDNP